MLEDARELGASLGALTSLAAGMTAAIAQNTFDPDHIYMLVDGYVSSLVNLQSRLEAGLLQLAANSAGEAAAPASNADLTLRTIGGGQRSHILDVHCTAAHT
jgi:hypothetical protein